MIKAGIIGATGYAGHQLTVLLHGHKDVSIEFMSSNSYTGKRFDEVYPHHHGIINNGLIDLEEATQRLSEIDVVFVALPHGSAFEIAEAAMKAGIVCIDLGADFRLDNKETYEHWYKTTHRAENLMEQAVYGLPELWREQIQNSRLIANPGCYTTASILALTPILKTDLVDPYSIVIDAKSGITGAGRKEDISLLYTEAAETIKAYGIASHRHTPEIEQELSKAYGDNEYLYVCFTPHLVPMKRGILATCYLNMPTFNTQDAIYEIYERFYHNHPFVRVRKDPVETRFVRNTNYCDISIRIDIRTRKLIITSAIDNLMKGAAGQAVQNMNIVFGLEETEGLKGCAVAP